MNTSSCRALIHTIHAERFLVVTVKTSKWEQNVYFTLSGGLCFHVASFEMQTVGWRGGKRGRGLREDESFVVLGFNELENTIALFWLWKLLWGHHKLAAGRYFNWQCFVWFLHMALYVSGGAFRGIQAKERKGIRDLSARTVNCFWSLEVFQMRLSKVVYSGSLVKPYFVAMFVKTIFQLHSANHVFVALKR